MSVEQAYHTLYFSAVAVLAAAIILCLIRALRGPRVTDRIVGVNMIGTQVILAIAILTTALSENWLADICIIYAMLSFVAAVVLTKVYMGVYRERKRRENDAKSAHMEGKV